MILKKLIVTVCCAVAPLATPGLASELTPEQVVQVIKGGRLVDDGANPFMVTGIPKRNMITGQISLLAFSPINPVALPATPTSKAAFPGIAYRPMTWSEADTACKSYKAAERDWRLPSTDEMSLLNNYYDVAANLFGTNAEEGTKAKMRAHWDELSKTFVDQYYFFWTSTADKNQTPGIMRAAVFGPKGMSQGMSMARPLSVICVAYFDVPEREVDRQALANRDLKDGMTGTGLPPGMTAEQLPKAKKEKM